MVGHVFMEDSDVHNYHMISGQGNYFFINQQRAVHREDKQEHTK